MSSFTTSQVTDFNDMFSDLSSLTYIDLCSFVVYASCAIIDTFDKFNKSLVIKAEQRTLTTFLGVAALSKPKGDYNCDYRY